MTGDRTQLFRNFYKTLKLFPFVGNFTAEYFRIICTHFIIEAVNGHSSIFHKMNFSENGFIVLRPFRNCRTDFILNIQFCRPDFAVQIPVLFRQRIDVRRFELAVQGFRRSVCRVIDFLCNFRFGCRFRVFNDIENILDRVPDFLMSYTVHFCGKLGHDPLLLRSRQRTRRRTIRRNLYKLTFQPLLAFLLTHLCTFFIRKHSAGRSFCIRGFHLFPACVFGSWFYRFLCSFLKNSTNLIRCLFKLPHFRVSGKTCRQTTQEIMDFLQERTVILFDFLHKTFGLHQIAHEICGNFAVYVILPDFCTRFRFVHASFDVCRHIRFSGFCGKIIFSIFAVDGTVSFEIIPSRIDHLFVGQPSDSSRDFVHKRIVGNFGMVGKLMKHYAPEGRFVAYERRNMDFTRFSVVPSLFISALIPRNGRLIRIHNNRHTVFFQCRACCSRQTFRLRFRHFQYRGTDIRNILTHFIVFGFTGICFRFDPVKTVQNLRRFRSRSRLCNKISRGRRSRRTIKRAGLMLKTSAEFLRYCRTFRGRFLFLLRFAFRFRRCFLCRAFVPCNGLCDRLRGCRFRLFGSCFRVCLRRCFGDNFIDFRTMRTQNLINLNRCFALLLILRFQSFIFGSLDKIIVHPDFFTNKIHRGIDCVFRVRLGIPDRADIFRSLLNRIRRISSLSSIQSIIDRAEMIGRVPCFRVLCIGIVDTLMGCAMCLIGFPFCTFHGRTDNNIPAGHETARNRTAECIKPNLLQMIDESF